MDALILRASVNSLSAARSLGRAGLRVVVASPAYLARRKKPRAPGDIASHEVIQFTALSPTPEWRFWRDDQPSQVSFTPRFVTNSADAALGHAEQGGGLTMVLAYQAVEAVRAGRLRVVLSEFEPPPLPIHLVYPTTRLLSVREQTPFLYVDVTDELTDLSSPGLQQALAQIVYTGSELDGVDRVQITVNGEIIAWPKAPR